MWNYLAGSDLKQPLTYPNGLSATWQYDAKNQLLQVCNAFSTNVVSQYDYTYDAAGCRVQIARSGSAMSEPRIDCYGYNERNELTSATKNQEFTEYQYAYDDIGNRLLSLNLVTNHTYTANALNQYTQISNLCASASLREEFFPQFDDDGNQTLVMTATGVWQVTYNGENRPILWTCGTTNIVMSFDRMGRRVEYVETVNSVTNTHHRFVYNEYVCIQRLNGAANNSIDLVFGWDPSEQVATRPLVLQKYGQYNMFYTHDGNKNVSELVYYQRVRGVAAHYEYAPFGEVTAQTRGNGWGTLDFSSLNPFRFSSEFADDALGLVYYNYRHYEPVTGRWMSRDLLYGQHNVNAYSFLDNECCTFDMIGLAYGNPVSGPNGPVGSGWGPYYPDPYVRPLILPSPGVWDQFNVFGCRGKSGKTDYREWFEWRFPKTVRGAQDVLTERIAVAICRDACNKPQTIPPLIDSMDDVDIKPHMMRFGDRPQSFCERWVDIGSFEFKADEINVKWDDDGFCYTYSARIYIQEHTGADFPLSRNSSNMLYDLLWFTGLFVSREVIMAEWNVQGRGCCDGKDQSN